MFGKLSAWLSQPHTADVHALEESKFHVVSTAAPLMQDPVAVPYVATAVERPEDSANRAQAGLKRQVQDGQLCSITRKTIDKIEELLGASGGEIWSTRAIPMTRSSVRGSNSLRIRTTSARTSAFRQTWIAKSQRRSGRSDNPRNTTRQPSKGGRPPPARCFISRYKFVPQPIVRCPARSLPRH